MSEHLEISPDTRSCVKLERLELALRASNEGIWDWWTDRQDIFYSKRILEFLECSKTNAPNLFLPPYDRIHPDDRDRFENAIRLAIHNPASETLAVDTRVLTSSGKWRWLRIRGTVVHGHDGRPARIAGSMIDISSRKAAEEQLEDERYLLRQLIDHVPLQIYFKNLHSQFTMANRGTAEWMGLQSTDQLIGKHDRDFFDHEHWKPAEEDERHVIETGEPIMDKLEHETWHEGRDTWVITSKFQWRDRHGQIQGTFGVSSDVTKLVKAQRAASQLAQELQHKNLMYEEELLLAREIQQALASESFQNNEESRKVTFGARYIPISGLAGDFFEVMKIHDDCYGFLICDVMGHGVRSALVVAILRGLLEKQRSTATDPGQFLQGLNEGLSAILERAGTTMFATAFFGVLDFTSESFKYACGGHPGPILQGPGGIRQIACERLEKGPGLGLIKNAVYPTHEIPISQIERMILFTDGVLEAENQKGEPFFEKRLIEIIAGKSTMPLEMLLDEILNRVLEFSEGQHFDDDVCLLGMDLRQRANH
jgi:sigma-B regulation protein RsbU (phosphoserine phosphatase)